MRVDLGTAVNLVKVLIFGVKCKLMIVHELLFKSNMYEELVSSKY